MKELMTVREYVNKQKIVLASGKIKGYLIKAM